MLEKIKKLLDSGCWVEVRGFIYNDRDTERERSINLHTYILGVNRKGEFVSDWGRIYADEKYDDVYVYNCDGIKNELYITSIKPIARPLYNYKVGDKVVVLDNYEGKYLKEQDILGYENEIKELQKNIKEHKIKIKELKKMILE